MAWIDRFISAEGVNKYLSGLEGVGQPVLYKEAEDTATQGLNIAANTGASHTKVALTKKSIPKPDDHAGTISYIKQVRAQLRIREPLQSIANQVTNGFRIKGTPEIKAWFDSVGMYSKVNRIAFELITTGFCVAYVTEPKGKDVLPQINILHNVQVRRSVDGSNLVFLQLSDEAKEAIRADSSNYPSTWAGELDSEIGINITRVMDSKGKVKSGGAYFITLEPDAEDMFPVSPLYAALGYSVDSEKVLLGLGSALDFVKHYLLQILVGNKDGQDMRDGRIKPVSKERVSSTLFSLSAGYTGGALVTPGDVTVQHNIPDKSPYTMHQDAVTQYGKFFKEDIGLPDFANVSSEGVASYLAKMFLPKLELLRVGIIEAQFLRPLMLQLADRVSGLDTGRILWSNSNTQDLKTITDRAKFQLGTGGVSIQYLNEMLDSDYDFDAQMTQKEIELKSKGTIGMPWEPSQNQSTIAQDMAATTSSSGDPSTDPLKPAQAKKVPTGLSDGAGRPTEN